MKIGVSEILYWGLVYMTDKRMETFTRFRVTKIPIAVIVSQEMEIHEQELATLFLICRRIGTGGY